jgi:membrane associated rhomboid family serine protease
MPYRDSTASFGFALTPWVKRLLIANTVVFLLTYVLPALIPAVPSLIPWLEFLPAAILSRPWTAFTYMFVHAGPWHILFNLLGLAFFGPPLEERWGPRAFIRFYLVCGLAGAVASLAFPYTAIVGASAAIYGVLVAFAMIWPDNPIYIWGILPVKAKWLVTFLVGLSVFYTLTGGRSGVAHLAHLGGAIAGFVYLKSPLAPSPWGEIDSSRRRRKRRDLLGVLRRRPRAVPQEPAAPRPPTPPRRRPAPGADPEIDRILDKIAEGGMDSLTPEERRHLEEASRRLRTH